MVLLNTSNSSPTGPCTCHQKALHGQSTSLRLHNTKYAFRRSQANQEELKVSGTHMLLDYADNIYLPDKNIYTVKKNTQAGLVNSEDVILAVNAEKTKCL
jgi:hypothetical protein